MNSPTHRVISAAEYMQQYHNGITIDLRTEVEHANEHMAFAHLRPVHTLRAQDLTELDANGEASTVYLLCQSGKRAFTAVEKLCNDTHCELVVIDGGLNALKDAGMETQSTPNAPMSLERQVRIAAGSLVLVGVALGSTLHDAYFGLSGFVGAGLIFAGVTNTCAMGLLLARMPWNKTPQAHDHSK